MKKTIILMLAAMVAFAAPSFVSDNAVVSAQTKKKARVKAEIKEVTFNVKLHCNNGNRS